MAAKLIAEEGFLKGLVLSLDEGEQWVIGRDPDACQLLVEDPSASRKHLICRTTPRGIVIENLSETNPVEVNEEKLEEPRLLHHGDGVKIGDGLFRFFMDTEAYVDGLPIGDRQGMIKQSIMEETQKQIQSASDQEKHDTIFDEQQIDSEKDGFAEIDFDLLDQGRWFLKVISGPNTGAEFSMQPLTSYVIGTDPATCDIVFHDASVSRQHARLNVGREDTIVIEDMKSRNGTFVGEEQVVGSKNVDSNAVITLGTTAFVVLDREGRRDTIISPLLPSIVKVLQRQEVAKDHSIAQSEVPVQENEDTQQKNKISSVAKATTHYGALILVAMVTGILVIAGIGTTTLFKGHEVIVPQINIKDKLADAFAPFPSVKYSYNKSSGRLLIVGHVLTAVDRTQLLYNIQGLTFVKSIDPNIIIDEYVWQEANQVLLKNPDWRGMTIHSPAPGRFVLTGYLKTRKQADQLSDYLSQNFSYLDLLEKKIVVEEDILTQTHVILQEEGLHDISIQMSNGEVSLSGAISFDRTQDLTKVLDQIKAISGVRSVNNFVVELAPEQAVVNLTSRYTVTGYSHQGDVSLSIVINGRILSRGDSLDGMTITSIKPNAIFLEKDGTKYRIDYNK